MTIRLSCPFRSDLDLDLAPTHLYAGLVQLGESCQFLPVVDVRVLVVSKGQFQLLQLLVAEGGAVASSGGRGERPARSALADSYGGLTQRHLPLSLPDICFQEGREEPVGGSSSGFKATLAQDKRTRASSRRVNAHRKCRGLRRLHGSQWNWGT